MNIQIQSVWVSPERDRLIVKFVDGNQQSEVVEYHPGDSDGYEPDFEKDDLAAWQELEVEQS